MNEGPASAPDARRMLPPAISARRAGAVMHGNESGNTAACPALIASAAPPSAAAMMVTKTALLGSAAAIAAKFNCAGGLAVPRLLSSAARERWICQNACVVLPWQKLR